MKNKVVVIKWYAKTLTTSQDKNHQSSSSILHLSGGVGGTCCILDLVILFLSRGRMTSLSEHLVCRTGGGGGIVSSKMFLPLKEWVRARARGGGFLVFLVWPAHSTLFLMELRARGRYNIFGADSFRLSSFRRELTFLSDSKTNESNWE